MPVLPRRAGRLEALAWECSGEGFGLELAGGATGAGMGMSMGSGVALTIAERSNLALGGKVVAVNGDHATTTITVVPGLTSPPEGALARVALLKHHLIVCVACPSAHAVYCVSATAGSVLTPAAAAAGSSRSSCTTTCAGRS